MAEAVQHFLCSERSLPSSNPASMVLGYKPYIKRHSFSQVRCSFYLLAWANGCHYNCEYCWLRAYHPWSWNEVHVAEKPALTRVLKRFCSKTGGSQLLNAGELCDSFVAPEYILFMAETLRQANEEYGCGHSLLLLTKSADPRILLENSLQDVVVCSASVNTETIAKDLEKGAPSPMKRIHAVQRLREAGYEVRVRIDPIIAGYESAYIGLMERVCCFVEPSLITLGFLRATPRTYRFLPPAIRAQLTERTPWGRGYPLQARLSTYNELVTAAKRYGVPIALCKEEPEGWKKLGLKGPCNCMPKKR